MIGLMYLQVVAQKRKNKNGMPGRERKSSKTV
jgi:hypothetical protein